MMEERRQDGERLVRLETVTETLLSNHKEMDTKLDKLIDMAAEARGASKVAKITGGAIAALLGALSGALTPHIR